MTSEVIGRQHELGLAEDLLGSLGRGPGALVLEGHAGSGRRVSGWNIASRRGPGLHRPQNQADLG